jgi:ABC-2 type transport system ATP-binding protein
MPLDTAAPPLEVVGLTKRYGTQTVVDGLNFAVKAGHVTGFLGPNGSGKTTTLRMVVGLAEPTQGVARVFGTRYAELREPSRFIGTLIDASGFHPTRRARHELAIHAATAGLDDARVPEVLAQVGLEAAGDKRVRELSLGMRQRLGLAAALLGQPRLLILDEPANGLDPAGMHWLRLLLRQLAADGAAIVVSSHVLSELALFADDVVVINHGRLVTQAPVDELVAAGTARVFVQSPKARSLARLLKKEGAQVTDLEDGLDVVGRTAADIGELAAREGIALHQLRTEAASLEDVFLELTGSEGGIR